MAFSLDDRPAVRRDLVTEDLDNEVVLYDSRGDVVHILNQSAREVWRLADGSLTVGEIAKALQDLFDVPSDVDLCEDVVEILELGPPASTTLREVIGGSPPEMIASILICLRRSSPFGV